MSTTSFLREHSSNNSRRSNHHYHFPDDTAATTNSACGSISSPFSLAFENDGCHVDATVAALSRMDSHDATDGVEVVGTPLTPNKVPQPQRRFLQSDGSRASSCQKCIHTHAGRIVQTVAFKRTKLGLILFNSILLSVRTIPSIRSDDDVFSALTNTAFLMAAWFTIELILEIAHYQWFLFTSGWLLFDVFLLSAVWLTGIPVWTMFRAFRLIRALRKASGFEKVQLAVQALLRVLPHLLALVGLLLLFLSVFAVVFTELFQFETNEETVALFGRLDYTLITLFQIMTMDNWSEIAHQMASIYYPSIFVWLLFGGFLFFTTALFTSLAIAVACQVTAHVHEERYWQPLERGGAGAAMAMASTSGAGVAAPAEVAKTNESTQNTMMTMMSSVAGQSHFMSQCFDDDLSLSGRDLHQQQFSVRRLEQKLHDLTAAVDRLTTAQQQSLMQQSQRQEPTVQASVAADTFRLSEAAS